MPTPKKVQSDNINDDGDDDEPAVRRRGRKSKSAITGLVLTHISGLDLKAPVHLNQDLSELSDPINEPLTGISPKRAKAGSAYDQNRKRIKKGPVTDENKEESLEYTFKTSIDKGGIEQHGVSHGDNSGDESDLSVLLDPFPIKKGRISRKDMSLTKEKRIKAPSKPKAAVRHAIPDGCFC